MHHKNAQNFEERSALIHFVKEYPLAMIAEFGLRKVVLRPETRFSIIKLTGKKSKNWILCDSCWAKSGFLVSGVCLQVIFGSEKIAKAGN